MPSSESRTEPCLQPLAIDIPRMSSVVVSHLPDERLDTTSTTINLVKGDLADDLVAMLSASIVSSIICGRRRRGMEEAYFLSFLIFSISLGILAAKTSLRDWKAN